MNTGRNWTRRSIEELIDDFLRRQKKPTPTSTAQYLRLPGKIASTNVGGAFIYVGVTGTSKPLPQGSNTLNGVCVEIPYRTSGVNMEYNTRNTYFPIELELGSGAFMNLPYVYFMPMDYYPGGYTGTCYKLTRTSTTAALPRIGNSDQNSYFTATVSPTSLHSIPTAQTTTIHPLAFCFGSSDVNLVAMQDLDTAVRDNIMTPLSKTMATALLSSVDISNADIQASFSGITNFQSLTY